MGKTVKTKSHGQIAAGIRRTVNGGSKQPWAVVQIFAAQSEKLLTFMFGKATPPVGCILFRMGQQIESETPPFHRAGDCVHLVGTAANPWGTDNFHRRFRKYEDALRKANMISAVRR